MTRSGPAYLCLILALAAAARAEDKSAPPDPLLLRQAQALYWRGLADHGNARAFRLALELVEQAAKTTKGARVAQLRDDITQQLDIALSRFYGVFPLVRVLGPAITGTVGPPGLYELVQPADVIASTTAAGKLYDKIVAEWKAHPQLHVVLRVEPEDNTAILHEVLYELASRPRFVVHAPAEVAGLRDPAALMRRLNVRNLLVVTVRKETGFEPEQLSFYRVTGRLYQEGRPDFARSIGAKAITLDRRAPGTHVELAHAAFLALAVLTGLLLRRPLRGGWVGPSGFILVASGFLLARVLAIALAPLLTSFAPIPEEPVNGSLWWPPLVGVALVLVPVAAIRLLLPRLRSLPGNPPVEGNLGVIGGAAGIGTAAFLAGPFAVLHGTMAWGRRGVVSDVFQGRRRPVVHRHGVGRGQDPGRRLRRRTAGPRDARRLVLAIGGSTRRRPRDRPDPPGHQAGQPDGHRGRRDQTDGLRHRSRDQRPATSARS